MASSIPSGTVTFLFSDIEGSTKKWESDPEGMRGDLARHDRILREGIERRGGYVFKTVGDAFCAAFWTAPEALNSALDIQRALAAERWKVDGGLKVRMGIHTGAAEERDEDYFGRPVNRAARVMSAGHGGQLLLSFSSFVLARDHAPQGVEFRDLGERRLKDLDSPERIFQVVVPDLPSSFPPLSTLDGCRHNLPSQATPLIGRDREVAEIRDMLAGGLVRLLTLTGPGGIGKTRLSLQVAAESIEVFPEGVYFVRFEDVMDPALALRAIASTLGVESLAGRSVDEALVEKLGRGRILVVADNLEQIEGVGERFAGLVRSCPCLSILGTSRSALRAYGEREYEVPPLPTPAAGSRESPERLREYDAVRLFIDRSTAVRRDFAVTNENAPAVAEICARLDGLPLAIELAAARSRMFEPEALLARLADRLGTLTGGARDLPRRQRTLRAAIDWSHELLGADERLVFRRASIFAGGFSLAAAEALCARGPGGEVADVIGCLDLLLEKCLIRRAETGAEPRFAMLATIREYAAERLESSGERPGLASRHLEYMKDAAERLDAEWDHPARDQRAASLRADLDNVRAALAWAFGPDGDVASGKALAASLLIVWNESQAEFEGRDWARMALERVSAEEPSLEAKLAFVLGSINFDLGDFAAARGYLERSATLFQAAGDTLRQSRAVMNLGWADFNGKGLAEAESRFAAALSLAEGTAFADRVALAALDSLAAVATRRGDAAKAELLMGRVLELARKRGRKTEIADAHFRIGTMSADFGDHARAADNYKTALDLFLEIGLPERARRAEELLGQGLCLAGRIEEARTLALSRGAAKEPRRLESPLVFEGPLRFVTGFVGPAMDAFEEAIRECERREDLWTLASFLLGMGEIHLFRGEYAAADARFSRALEVAARMNGPWMVMNAHVGLYESASLRGDYAEAEALAAVFADEIAAIGDRAGLASAHAGRAALLHAMGRYEEALPVHETALRMNREAGRLDHVARTLHSRAASLMAAGRASAAEEDSRAGLELARSLGGWCLADCLDARGSLLDGRGDREEAAAVLDEACALRLELRNPRGLAGSLERRAGAERFTRGDEAALGSLGMAAAIREAIGAPRHRGSCELDILIDIGNPHEPAAVVEGRIRDIRRGLSEASATSAWEVGAGKGFEIVDEWRW